MEHRQVKKLGCAVAILAVLGGACSLVLLARRRQVDAQLDGLLSAYEAYGLPLPPDDAELVRVDFSVQSDSGGAEWAPLCLGFLIGGGRAETPPTVLAGTTLYEPPTHQFVKVVSVEPDQVRVTNVQPCWRHAVFEINAGLAAAIQCKNRGWDALARALLKASLKVECGHDFSGFYQAADTPPRTALAFMAWAHWANELIRPDSDRAVIARRMRALLESEPKLDAKTNRELLASLEAALVPSKAEPGSVQAMIDDLTNVHYDRTPHRDEHDARYMRILRLGFDAVPALIEHIDDVRMTRNAQGAENHAPARHLRVSDLVCDLLRDISGKELDKKWLYKQRRYNMDKAQVFAWWKRAQAVGEETYLVEHALPKDEKVRWSNRGVLWIMAEKYPHRLPEVYRAILDERPQTYSWLAAELIGAGPLPREKKIELFAHAGRHENLELRATALGQLKDLDEERFVAMLIETLKCLPRTPEKPYWKCPEASLAGFVVKTNDSLAWKTLLEVARRSDVGLRMQILGAMNLGCPHYRRTPVQLDLMKTFLAEFLDDEEVRDESSNPDMFDGPQAGFMFPRLEVRDFAAMQIASILEMSVCPLKTWTPQQWAEFRSRVRKRLSGERPASPK